MGARELTFLSFPFTLAYAAAVLESKGMPVLVLDAIGEDLREDEYYRRICEFQPDLIINETSFNGIVRSGCACRTATQGPHRRNHGMLRPTFEPGIHEAYCVIRQ